MGQVNYGEEPKATSLEEMQQEEDTNSEAPANE